MQRWSPEVLLRIICKLGGDEVICTAGEDLRARLRLAIPQSAFKRDDLPRWRFWRTSRDVVLSPQESLSGVCIPQRPVVVAFCEFSRLSISQGVLTGDDWPLRRIGGRVGG